MAPKKDPEEELADQLRMYPALRPLRTYCESCDKDCGSRLGLLQHIRLYHPA